MPVMTTTTSAAEGPELHPLDAADPGPTEEYTTDLLNRRRTLIAMAAAAVGGGLFTLLAWYVLTFTSLPAFSTSMVTKALATAGTVLVLLAVGAVVVFWLLDEQRSDARRRARQRKAARSRGTGATAASALTANAADESTPEGGSTRASDPEADHHDPSAAAEDLQVHRPRWRVILTYLVSYLSPAALVVTTTAIPLSSTRLYLDGIQVDQGFRTQFLTRMTDTIGLSDMNYIDMPTYYPGGWFWFGGRFADLLGMEGWAAYQPWALVSIAATAAMLVPVWQRLCGSLPVATGIALVSTCVVLVMGADEPYAVIVALGVPAATILARRAVSGSRFCMLALTLYLGASASMYTLYTGVVALSVILIAALFAAFGQRSWKPVLRMILIGLGSVAIALIFWGPFLFAALSGQEMSGATATHFLPLEGTEIPVPFLSPSVIGFLCLLGLIFLIVRAVDQDLRAMGFGLVVFYGWSVASMVATLAGSTLLGFRMSTIIVLQLATAGVLALADIRMVGVERLYPNRISPKVSRVITVVMVVVVMLAGLKYAQDIPYRNQDQIDQAYTDTDGFGERGDRRTPDAGTLYSEIDEHIQSFGHEPTETVVLTDEINFLAYNPYHGFQAFTSHYANPLGEFARRNTAIETWAEQSWDELADPADFAAELETAPWQAPDVFIMRGSLEEPESGAAYHLAMDIYPSSPNVRYDAVYFNLEPFTDPGSMWDTTQIGPFVVVTREN